jgi:hypothetical protein
VDKIYQSVVSKLQDRHNKGVKEYGTTMEENNGNLLYWLNHLQEELMDSIVYIEKKIELLENCHTTKEEPKV